MTKKALLLDLALIAAAGLGYTAGHAQLEKMIAANDMEWKPMGPDSPL